MTLDIKRASRETRDEVSAAVLDVADTQSKSAYERYYRARDKLIAECAPPKLRTRAERDRDLMQFMVDNFGKHDLFSAFNPPTANAIWSLMLEPVCEPTTDTPPAPSEEVEQLRARVKELNQELVAWRSKANEHVTTLNRIQELASK